MEKTQYDELKMFQNEHWWFKARQEIIIDLANCILSNKSNLRVLDLGCGMGEMIPYLKKYGETFGIDIEPDAIDYCIQNYKSDTDHFRIGSLPGDIPFSEESFDVIFALDVLEHIQNDREGAKKIQNLLTPHGTLILTVPALMALWSYNDVINHHFRRYEKKELIDVLKYAGFKIRKITFFNSILFFPAFLTRKTKKIFQVKKPDIKKTNPILNKFLYNCFKLEKYWLKKHNFCIGVSLIVLAEKE